MAVKQAKTAQKAAPVDKKLCPECGAKSGSEVRVVRYTGFGPRGLFWACDKNCGYMQRTH